MLFQSLSFAVFMTVVFLLYWLLPHKYRWLLLLAANGYFYLSFDSVAWVVLLVTLLTSYFTGMVLEKQEQGKRKRVLFAAGVLSVLVFLFVFKYLGFAVETVEKVLKLFAVPVQETTLKLLMPAGISFYSFQMIGYLADVYRGKIKAEHHLGKYAVFVSFFPNISSGPIERAGHFLPQLEEKKSFDYEQVVCGSRLLLWGMLKKAVFADKFARYADLVFNNVYAFSGLSLVLATLLYTFQIYCDFSAYSDMAIGLGKMLGFELPGNFKSPYFATSITDFWSRWHISLSTWFRDYVYIPLGGNRVSKARRNVNLMVTFLVSGLWHGANWTFVLWGGIHGICQVVEKTLKEAFGSRRERGKRIRNVLAGILTFCIVSYAWMFFRANSISEALYIAGHMFTEFSLATALSQMSLRMVTLLKLLAAVVFLMLFDYANERCDVLDRMGRLPAAVRWVLYVAAAVLVLHGGQSQQFIYFNF